MKALFSSREGHFSLRWIRGKPSILVDATTYIGSPADPYRLIFLPYEVHSTAPVKGDLHNVGNLR